jgi:chemotaxis protein CheZ
MTGPERSPQGAFQNLQEANALLNEGIQRIMGAASDLPDASHPLQEALMLSEEQAMVTLEAVEAAQTEVAAIRATNGGFIDVRLDRLEQELQTILTSQQGQDLAGQRLKKSITLLQAVEQRVRDALQQLGVCVESDPAAPAADPAANLSLEQSHVDDLLAQLGL